MFPEIKGTNKKMLPLPKNFNRHNHVKFGKLFHVILLNLKLIHLFNIPTKEEDLMESTKK